MIAKFVGYGNDTVIMRENVGDACWRITMNDHSVSKISFEMFPQDC